MKVPQELLDAARNAVCAALAHYSRRRGALGLIFRKLERLACDAAAGVCEEAYQRGWNDCNFASISSLANREES